MPPNTNSFMEALYLREYDRLMRTAYHLVKDRSLAENLVHETFLLAILHQKELAVHRQPGAWLRCSLYHFVQNERRSAPYGDIPLEAAAELPAESPPLPLTELLPTGLKPEERELLILRFERQLSYKEISDLLYISETACRKRLSRALARCKRLLGGR